MVNFTATSTTPALDTRGESSRSVVPSLLASTTARVPNHTYTGTVVGNRPLIVSDTPPSIDANRGDIESTRHTPSVSGGGAGVVVAGTVVAGIDVAGAVVAGTVVTGAVVAGVVVGEGVGAAVVPGDGMVDEGEGATEEVGLVGAVVGVGSSEVPGGVVGVAGALVVGAAVTGEVGAVVAGAVVGDGPGLTDVVGPGASVVEGAGATGAFVVGGDVMGEVGTVVVVIPGPGATTGGSATFR